MGKRGFGLLFLLTFVIAIGTLVQDFRFDTVVETERDRALALDRQLGSTTVALADLRGAQAGYVAMGQGPAVWIARATDLFNQIETAITTLRSSTAAPDASVHYDAALAALSDLKGIDAHARTDATGDRRYEASDRVFTDTHEANDRLAAELAAARTAEEGAAVARVTRINRLRLAMNGVALAFVLAVAAFFWRARASATATQAAEDAAPAPRSDLSLRLNAPPPAERAPVVERATIPAVEAKSPVAERPVTRRDVNLTDAAELCVDLARVMDSRDVPALLERAATVLDAKGIILWMSDSGGALLRPSVAHGYSDRILTKMGALQVDGDNATSLAFRSLRGQTVNGAASSAAGAIAVPLITSSGCVGVLAAEVNRQRPSVETLDVARIIAAQLAALVVPSADASRVAQG